MTKILKKSLACLLVFALCFTAIASCLAVSAAAPVAGFDYKTYFPNDSKVWAVCAGQNVRAQLSMTDLEAGATIGLSIAIPKGAEITSIDGWNWGTNCQLKEVSKYFNEEDSVVTIIYDVVASGNYMLFVRYDITEEVEKKVHFLDVTFEAAFASDDEITEYTVTDYYEVFDHDVIIDAAVAPGCETTGLTEGSHCSRCGLVLVAQEEVAATGHAWDAGVPNPDATCDSEGTMLYTCTNDPSHTYTEAISPKGHTPAADLVDNEDGTHSEVCDVCGAVLSTVDHEYVDGTCACGAAEPSQGVTEDPNLVFQGASLGIGDNSLEMTFRIRQTTLALYDDVRIAIIPQKYDGNLNLIVPAVEKEIKANELVNANQSGSIQKYVYADFELYELGLEFEYLIRAYDAQGNLVAVSQSVRKSAATYLKDLYVNATDAMKTLITDTLIVGEEAIKRMKASYPTAEIANAASVIEGFDISKATASVGTPNSIDDIDCKDEAYTFGGATSTYVHALRRSAGVGKAPYLSYRIYNKAGTALDISKLSVRVAFDKYDGTEFNETFTSADGVITHTGTGNWTNVTLQCIPMPDSNKDITIEISYNGEVKTVMTYSIETYLNSVASDSDLYDLSVALIKLGVGFRNLKASLA